MRRYVKLFGLYFLIGFGCHHGIQSVQARPYVKKTSVKSVKHSVHHTGSTKKITPYYIRQKKAHVSHELAASASVTEESGVASWYPGRQQRKSENQHLTAAHPSLPFGTKVLVRSEDTGNSVTVTINDRGPFVKHRIIDLSKAAAAKIGMLHSGVAHVTITPLTNTEVAEAPEEQK